MKFDKPPMKTDSGDEIISVVNEALSGSNMNIERAVKIITLSKEGKAIKEIAANLNITRNAVIGIMHRLRQNKMVAKLLPPINTSKVTKQGNSFERTEKTGESRPKIKPHIYRKIEGGTRAPFLPPSWAKSASDIKIALDMWIKGEDYSKNPKDK